MENFRKKFLVNSSETGRYIVFSFRTKKQYFVEPIGDPHLEWGSLDQRTGKLIAKKGWKKFRGSIDEENSMITKENGFSKVHNLEVGMNPLGFIEQLDKQYPTILD